MKLVEVVSRRSFLGQMIKIAGSGFVSLLVLSDDIYAKNGAKKGKGEGGNRPPENKPPGNKPDQPPENRPDNPPEKVPDREKDRDSDPCDQPENWGKPPCEHLVPKNN